MQATIQEVTVNTVTKGRNTYQVAEVVYSANGKNGTKKLFSFKNPAVFSTIKDATRGSNWDIESRKEGDFWEWVDAKPSGEAAAAAKPAYGGGKVTGSNYETSEERKLRQTFIIKQSSIGHAVELLTTGAKTPPSVEDVLAVAQKFVDYVYGTNELAADILRPDEPNDIPY